MRVIVVGGGIIGTSAAYYLSKLGIDVFLIEGKDIASGTSSACDQAIMLQSKRPGPALDLAIASAKLYSRLEEELGEDLEYNNGGGMIVIETMQELEAMKSFVERQRNAGMDVQILSGDEARERQPGLSEHIIGATWYEQDADVNPMLVCFAMAKAAKRNGAKIRTNTEVTGLIMEKGKIIGVELSGEKLYADSVLLAAGVWTPFILKQIGIHVPIIPRKGQILVAERMEPLFPCNILSASYIANKMNPKKNNPEQPQSAGLSLGQTRSGTLLIGGSREFAGYDITPNVKLAKDIANVAVRILPVLKNTHIIRTFAGLRPYTPDGLPIIGKTEEAEGLYIAAGHEGDGIALAPITGKIIAELIGGIDPQFDVDAFSPNRFANNMVG